MSSSLIQLEGRMSYPSTTVYFTDAQSNQIKIVEALKEMANIN